MIYFYFYIKYVDKDDESNQASALNLLQWNQFIMNVRENCKVSHTAVGQIIDGVTNLFDVYSNIILVSIFYVLYFIYIFF